MVTGSRAPIAIQLYTVREQLERDFEGVIRRIGQIGYAGVEMSNQYGDSPDSTASLFRELGLSVCSAHLPLPLGDEQQRVLETIHALGTKNLVCASLPKEDFNTRDGVKRGCARLNAANQVARANGLRFLYHNHWWECQPLSGRPAYKYMLDELEPTVDFEVDVYWAKTGGVDPATMVRELGARAPLLHVKDGPATRDASQVAVGDGVMEFRAIAEASNGFAEWMIVELDHCATDMLEAVQKSYTYLTSNGFAHGRPS